MTDPVNVSKYNCDTTALESLPLDKDFSSQGLKIGGGRRTRQQQRSRQRSRQQQRGNQQRKSRQQQRSRQQQQRSRQQQKKSRQQQRSRQQRRSRQQQRSRQQRSRQQQKKSRQQRGGSGYFLKVEGAQIGGLPEVTGYNSQPELVNGKMVKSALDERLCGGGKRRVNNLRSNNTGKRTKRISRRSNRKARRGRIVYRKVGGSKEGVFTADMSQREFGCRQPNWDPKCI